LAYATANDLFYTRHTTPLATALSIAFFFQTEVEVLPLELSFSAGPAADSLSAGDFSRGLTVEL
jgi:hypothetical protein